MKKKKTSSRVRYTEEQNKWLKENYNKYVSEEISNAFYKEFGVLKKYKTINAHCTRELKLNKDTNGQLVSTITKEQEDFISQNYYKYYLTELTKKYNERFNTKLKSVEHIVRKLKLKPRNKKERMKSLVQKIRETLENKYPIGSEIVSEAGFVYIKTSNGKGSKNWELKHYVIWEKAYGEIPKNHNIIFLDNNKNNFDLSNLRCVDKKVFMSYKHYKNNDVKFNSKALDFLEISKQIEEIMGERK